MDLISRRKLLALAAPYGASLTTRAASAGPSRMQWQERRELYLQGVASGDPHSDSVILWTRRPHIA